MTAAPRRPRGSSYPVDVIARAKTLYVAGHTPTQIGRLLARELRETPEWAPPVPTIKTWVKGLRRASDAPWDFLGATAEECKLLAPAFNYGLDRAAGADLPDDSWPTQSEAEWMVRIAQLTRGWSPQRIHELGRYAAATAADERERQDVAKQLMVLALPTAPSPLRVQTLQSARVIGGGTAVPEVRDAGVPMHGGAAVAHGRDDE